MANMINNETGFKNILRLFASYLETLRIGKVEKFFMILRRRLHVKIDRLW